MGGQFLFQRGQEGREDVDHEAVGGRQDFADILVDDSVKDDGASAIALSGKVDLLYHGARFFHTIDVRTCEFVEANILELSQ
ncbi:hypothetical protein D9M71_439590 [compost metagenome]